METISVDLTKEEAKALLTQINARIDSLKELQLKAGKSEDIKRVIELEEFMKVIIFGRDKIMNAIYSI
ncbi:hypothetical protein [Bacillus pumilus]|uniref:hypothetical protein n=1 Tax=Bacillus pumilus TaxID=1408 RepID=UPI003D069570